MAAQLQAAQQFRTVQIFKTQSLGLGSYGAVYKAKADQLPCAAKLLHPILFQDRDPGARRILQRFEQECQFLNGIRHPNIVQYLGTCTDRDSGLPALLMELMDESLTHFLETSQQPLPYHLEVNLLHDVALALDFLHSNGIVHRDLSSNNVLLIAGTRAKVTDFGMSKLLDTALHTTPQTQCPGTMSYMSPEALRIPPVYSKKLDCFSFGVLGIQIMTRQFPDPGPAKQVVDYPQSPVGTIEMPVLERERRKKHIDLISPNHPLLSTALRCLEYHEKNRPSAQELCHQLATLKEDPTYTQSVTREEGRRSNAAAEIAAKNEQIEELQQQLRNERGLKADFQQQLLQKEGENRDLREIVRVLQEQLQLIPKKKWSAAKCMPDVQALKWEQKHTSPKHLIGLGTVTAVDGSTVYACRSGEVYAYVSQNDNWTRLPDCPTKYNTLAFVNGLLTAVSGVQLGKITNTLSSLVGEGSERKWIEHFPPIPTARLHPAVVCNGRSLVAAGGKDGFKYLSVVEVMDTDILQWFTASSLPHPFCTASATICGNHLYMMGGFDDSGAKTKLVLTCSVTALLQSCHLQMPEQQLRTLTLADVWHKVANAPLYYSTGTTLCGQLLAIGGRKDNDQDSNSVHKYNPAKNNWSIISQMPEAESFPLVEVLPGNKLLVLNRRNVYTASVVQE